MVRKVRQAQPRPQTDGVLWHEDQTASESIEGDDGLRHDLGIKGAFQDSANDEDEPLLNSQYQQDPLRWERSMIDDGWMCWKYLKVNIW